MWVRKRKCGLTSSAVEVDGCLGSGVGGFWKMQKPRRREGGESNATILRPQSRSGHSMHGRGRSLANGSPGESPGNANGHSGTLSHTHALVWGHSAGMRTPGMVVNGHSDADVSGHCFRGRVYGYASRSGKKEARFGMEGGMFAQPHRWRIDQSSIDRSHMLERRSSVGGAKKCVQ
jgi:hypothetical protein